MIKQFVIGRKTIGIENRVTSTGLSLKKLLLPNVSRFNVKVIRDDKILEQIGIGARFRRLVLLEEAANKKGNKYLKRLWTRLHKYALRNESERFEKLTQLVMNRSNSLIALGIWRTIPLWYKILSWKRLNKAIYKLNRIRNKDHWRFEYKRVFIPKPDGTKRPLSVPSIEWRVISNIKNIFLKIWLETPGRNLTPCQHGLMLGLGPKQAWERILTNLNKRNIYEFDLAKFFDSVHWNQILKNLADYNIPKNLANWLWMSIRYSTAAMGPSRLLELYEHYDSQIPKLKDATISDLLSKRF